ncbi:MAG: hypothetical protein ABIZ80_20430 [Bryobacteraceae bacterium]
MAQEAQRRARLGQQSSEGKASLGGGYLLFRGDFGLKMPLKEMTSVVAADGCLAIRSPGGVAA